MFRKTAKQDAEASVPAESQESDLKTSRNSSLSSVANSALRLATFKQSHVTTEKPDDEAPIDSELVEDQPKIIVNPVSSKDGGAKKPEEPQEDDGRKSWYHWAWTAPRNAFFRRNQTDQGTEDLKVSEPDPASMQDNDTDPFKAAVKDKEGGSWAFWAKKKTETGDKDEGELAISGTETAQEPREVEITEAKPVKSKKPVRPSLVVPSCVANLEYQSSGSRIFHSLAKFGLGSSNRLYRTLPLPVRRCVVVGVHGYFPARMTRVFLGEPTGTSIKFANEAAAEVEAWATQHGRQIEIEKIALEGEGKIEHRVESLYRLLLNWQNLIRQADFIFFAAHSQGTVVSVHLITKLIQDGYITNQRIGLLGMAGTCLGPTVGMDQSFVGRAITTIENDSLYQLFELQRLESELSRAFFYSIGFLLRYGVKIILVGATDDQLVPLYSSLCINVRHPNLMRAAYLDGEDVAPEVIAPLLELAIQLLNAGQSDSGIISELSSALSGAMRGKGHSKLYSCDKVYRFGIEAVLETTTSVGVEAAVDHDFAPPRNNPYVLPWAMNQFITTVKERPEHHELLEQLYEEYDRWRPDNKALKDLKFRLGAMKQAKL